MTAILLLALSAAPPTDRIKVRLVSAAISEKRGQNLLMRLMPDKGPALVVEFPAHSFTPHEKTLRAAVFGAVPRPSNSRYGWSDAEAEVVFSIPHGFKEMRHASRWGALTVIRLVSAEKAKR